MTIDTFSCSCNMTYEYYINQPLHAVELRLNLIIVKIPQLVNLLDRIKNHPLIRKYSHTPLYN